MKNEKSKYTELLKNLKAIIDEYKAGKDSAYCLGQVSGLVIQAEKDGLTNC